MNPAPSTRGHDSSVGAIVARWRMLLFAAVAYRALALGVGSWAGVTILARLLGGSREAASVLGGMCGVGAALLAFRSIATGLTRARTALWIERQVPALRFALVSWSPEHPHAGYLARAVQGVPWQRAALAGLVQSLWLPTLSALVGVAALGAVPPIRVVIPTTPTPARGAGAGPSALQDLRVTVRPPAYLRRPVLQLRDPSIVRAIRGSQIVMSAPLPPGVGLSALKVLADSNAIALAEADGRWSAEVLVGERPIVLVARHGANARLISVEPLLDSVPTVVFRAPLRDSVVRDSTSRIALAADASDDIGLTRGAVEYIVTSGSGERFTFRSGTLGARALRGQRGALSAMLDLGALKVSAGDIIHLRAVALDNNGVTGPGKGFSETRTIRVARASEYDSVAVEAAPPPEVDKSILSQRMLINITEALLKQQRAMDSSRFRNEVLRVARDQGRLRKLISDLVFARLGDQPNGEHFHGDGHNHGENEPELKGPPTPEELLKAAERATQGSTNPLDVEGDETPIVNINRPLLEAYNAMWDAGRELGVVQPRQALPHMYVALAAIQRARAAERIYLRTAPSPVVIDLEKVRLAGKDLGVGGARSPRAPQSGALTSDGRRLSTAITNLATAPAAAVDSLVLLRLELSATRPAAAAAIEELLAAVRRGGDVTAAALEVRRALLGRAAVRRAVDLWGGTLP